MLKRESGIQDEINQLVGNPKLVQSELWLRLQQRAMNPGCSLAKLQLKSENPALARSTRQQPLASLMKARSIPWQSSENLGCVPATRQQLVDSSG